MTFDDSSVAGLGATPVPDSAAAQVAIVGSGPSGCFTAIALRRLVPTAQIVMFDARHTPFGLVRYGVAPDHQGMKNISRQFDRLFTSGGVNFVGNTRIGREVSLADLQASFDAVVLATGLPQDRPLDIAVPAGAPVVGAGELLRMLNGDPDSALRTQLSPLGREVVILGAGNVAIDVMRLICKDDSGFVGSDVDDDARAALMTTAVEHITVLARGPRDGARWDGSMFTELCALPGVTITIDRAIVEQSTIATDAAATRAVTIDIRFNEPPVRIDLVDGRWAVHTAPVHRSDERTYQADTVITARGFVASGDYHPAAAEVQSAPILRVGGCASGTLGNLAQNRAAAKTAARQVAEALAAAPGGRAGLTALAERLHNSVSFTDWTAIDRAETARARPDRLRTKFTTWQEMTTVIAAGN